MAQKSTTQQKHKKSGSTSNSDISVSVNVRSGKKFVRNPRMKDSKNNPSSMPKIGDSEKSSDHHPDKKDDVHQTTVHSDAASVKEEFYTNDSLGG